MLLAVGPHGAILPKRISRRRYSVYYDLRCSNLFLQCSGSFVSSLKKGRSTFFKWTELTHFHKQWKRSSIVFFNSDGFTVLQTMMTAVTTPFITSLVMRFFTYKQTCIHLSITPLLILYSCTVESHKASHYHLCLLFAADLLQLHISQYANDTIFLVLTITVQSQPPRKS